MIISYKDRFEQCELNLEVNNLCSKISVRDFEALLFGYFKVIL